MICLMPTLMYYFDIDFFLQHLKTQNFRSKYVFGKNLKFETFQHDGQYIIKNYITTPNVTFILLQQIG